MLHRGSHIVVVTLPNDTTITNALPDDIAYDTTDKRTRPSLLIHMQHDKLGVNNLEVNDKSRLQREFFALQQTHSFRCSKVGVKTPHMQPKPHIQHDNLGVNNLGVHNTSRL